MRRMEEMFKKLAEAVPLNSGQPTQGQPLAGGGGTHSRAANDKEPSRERERSPRREDNQTS